MFGVFPDALTFMRLCFRPTATIAAENLFLRKQLGLFMERKIRPRRATDAIRFTLARLSHLFDWRNGLTIVKPDTLIRWHRKGFRLLWKWKSQPCGRPRVPAELRQLISEMATSNPTWGEERIADELLLKIGIRPPQRPADPKQRWMTLVRNHAKAIMRFLRCCDGNVPTDLRLLHHRSQHAKTPSFQCHAPPDGRLDAAAVSRVCYGR
jgi:putative transposase